MSASSSYSGRLNDVASPVRGGGISYEVSSLSYFAELLDEENEIEEEMEAGANSQERSIGALSRIEDQMVDKHIRRGQLLRQDVIVGGVLGVDTDKTRSPRTRRVFSFTSGRTRAPRDLSPSQAIKGADS